MSRGLKVTNDTGMWPSGKAPASGAGDRRFDPYHPSQVLSLDSIESFLFGGVYWPRAIMNS
jgi:hypothetical protein